MAKKEFPEKFPPKAPKIKDDSAPKDSSSLFGDFSSKFSGLSSKLFGVVKFLLAVFILPFVFSSAVSFLNEFSLVDKILQKFFWNGAITFLAIYLFVWEPAAIYNQGHKFLELIFGFLKPMFHVAPFLLPIYTILIFIIYGLASLWTKDGRLLDYTIFLAGFSIVLHLVFAAKTIRTKKGDFLKANYIFGFSFIFIVNLILLSACFSLVFKGFSFVNFCNISFTIAKSIFYAVFKQLFVL